MLPLTTDKAAYFSVSKERGKIDTCHSDKIESAEAHNLTVLLVLRLQPAPSFLVRLTQLINEERDAVKIQNCRGQITTFDGATLISGRAVCSSSESGESLLDSYGIGAFVRPTAPVSERSNNEYVDAAHLGVVPPSRDGSQRLSTMFDSPDQGQTAH